MAPMVDALDLQDPAQRDDIARLVPRWLGLPVYRSRLAELGLSPPTDASGFDWRRLPFITKRDMRENFPHNFLAPGQSLDSLVERSLVELEHTSGTSEERVPVLLGRGWWDVQEARVLRLNAFVARVLDESPQARRVVLTTPTCNGMVCHSKWMPKAQRTLGTALYINQSRIPFALTEDDLARMAEEMAEWQPVFLDLDPVHGAWFALYCERRGLTFPSLRFVLASYEFVSITHRRVLERVFGVPVFNLYGSTETGHLMMQDTGGTMRPCAENAFLELVETGADGVGHVVVTTLTNDFMPLVRYRIGDLALRMEPARPATYVVHGRARDVLRRADGARVTTWQVDQLFTDLPGVAHYQVRQAETGECSVRLLPDAGGVPAGIEAQVATRLADLLLARGRVAVEVADMLVPAPSGKFRLTFQG